MAVTVSVTETRRPTPRKTGKWLFSPTGEIGVGVPAVIDAISNTRALSPSEKATRVPSGDHLAAWHAKVHWLFASVARSFVTAAALLPSLPTVHRSIVPR